MQLYENQREKLLSLLTEFEDLLDNTLVKWDTTPDDLDVKTISKPFNARYYMVTKINNETFHKDLQHLVDIGVLTPVQ